jgi:hypothetical protein
MTKSIWDMTKEELEAMLGKGIKEEIAGHHAAGRSTVHGDDKGIYLIHPDGTREYVELYNWPKVHPKSVCKSTATRWSVGE